MKQGNYIIGSGWWCSENDGESDSVNRKLLGDNTIRSKEFHNLWYESVCNNSCPEKIIIIDSNSPIKPELNTVDQRLELISLPVNSGHSTSCKGQFCGWTKSVLLGLQYAILSEVDYFVYVEQDVLLHGQNIIEHCIGNMTKPFMFGSGKGTPQPLQQSFFIIKISHAALFINNMHRINKSDKDMSPEIKFSLATSKSNVMLGYLSNILSNKLLKQCLKVAKGYDVLPVGYGRTRPINFSDEFFYFQHGSKSELYNYGKLD